VAAGGTTGEIMVKASDVDYATQWATSNTTLFTFTGTPPMNILGTESSGAVVASYIIPASALPNQVFNWIIQSSGYGTFFGTNLGTTGTPSGSYSCQVWDGTAWVTCSNLPGAAFTAPDSLYRGGASSPGSSRIFHYDPAILNEIRFQLVVSGAPATAFTLNIGMQGMIISFL
jgi:hypothetical protein